MKIRMDEHFQGRDLPTLGVNQEYEVGKDITKSLADWLLENRKARVVEELKPVQAQDDDTEAQEAQPELEPEPEKVSRPKGRKK